MNIRELIVDSEVLVQMMDNDEQVTVDIFIELLGLDKETLSLLLEEENVIFDLSSESIISTDILKQIVFKEPETSRTPAELRDQILGSEYIMGRIKGNKPIMLITLCKGLGLSMTNMQRLLLQHQVVVEKSPVAKIDLHWLQNLLSDTIPKAQLQTTDLKDLKQIIENLSEQDYTKSVTLNRFVRNQYISTYAKLRACGICELCDQEAPFRDRFGKPFLETHHIVYLSKGGKDSIDNVVALCPNCHRRIHNLASYTDLQKLLMKRESEIGIS